MHGQILDVVITRGVSSIIQDTPNIVDLCLYDVKDNQSADHFGIEARLNSSRPQNYRNEITFHSSKRTALLMVL